MVGIYKITNKLNNKFYIGQSVDIHSRWESHKRSSKNYNGVSLIYQAFNKYGIDNFDFQVLEECDKELLNELEFKYIKEFEPEYNIRGGGDSLFTIAEETKRSISKKLKGRKIPEESLKKRIKSQTGLTRSEDVINSMRKNMTNKLGKKVICLNTGVVYDSIHEAGRQTNSSYKVIWKVCKGICKTYKGNEWRFLNERIGQ